LRAVKIANQTVINKANNTTNTNINTTANHSDV